MVSAQTFTHGNHSHGPALTEVERQASEGVFADADLRIHALSDWEGVWQSVGPRSFNGDLDPVLELQANHPRGKSVEADPLRHKKGHGADLPAGFR
ncbi:ZinT/AdcA family metal-binding protein [Klebsiella pneumoniae]|uniref:ZinT/AdcA family metal-binding protein n=1 Tax=Klebsiella pneumoniae TaxID=573 RepID=UPI003987A61F